MNRYYNEDPDETPEPFFGSDDDDDGDNDEILEGDVVGIINQQDILDVMHMNLAQAELNQHLLSKAIEIAQNNWFWSFKSTKSKMREIEAVYKRLLKITETESEWPDKSKGEE
jgi:uncharacterized protein with gpF-like domain